MIPQREIRYYASIPKIFMFLLGSSLFAAGGWWTVTTQHAMKATIGGGVLVGIGCCGCAVFLAWLVEAIVVRKPLLRINEIGFTSSLPLFARRGRFVPWADVKGICIGKQVLKSGTLARNTVWYLIVDVRDVNKYPSQRPKLASLSTNMYPSLAHTALMVQLNRLYLFASRRRRADMLERIKATFASEIIRYHIDLAMEEQLL